MPAELAGQYFEVGPNSRFLATVGRVRDQYRKTFEAALLGDGFVRVHTVDKEENPRYHALLLAAGKATGLPVLYNTSFNLSAIPWFATPAMPCAASIPLAWTRYCGELLFGEVAGNFYTSRFFVVFSPLWELCALICV